MFLVFIEVVFMQYDNAFGYNKYEIFLIASVANVNYSLWSIVLHNLNDFPSNITEGGLDKYLVKPINAVYLTAINSIDISKLLSGVLWVILSGVALLNVNFIVNSQVILALIFVEILFAVTFFAFVFTLMIMAFWWGNIDNAYWAFESVLEINRYPVKAFTGLSRFIFVYFLPVVLCGAVQVDILTGRFVYTDLFLYGVIMVVWVVIARFVWKKGLKSYASSSSGGGLN